MSIVLVIKIVSECLLLRMSKYIKNLYVFFVRPFLVIYILPVGCGKAFVGT